MEYLSLLCCNSTTSLQSGGVAGCLYQVDSLHCGMLVDFTLHGRQDLLHEAYKRLLAVTFNAQSFIAMAEQVRKACAHGTRAPLLYAANGVA
jgi:hypothetical protein